MESGDAIFYSEKENKLLRFLIVRRVKRNELLESLVLSLSVLLGLAEEHIRALRDASARRL